MSKKEFYTAIGLMSGTSLDGIDVALIKTDGHSTVERMDFKSYPYSKNLRLAVRPCFGMAKDDRNDRVKRAEDLLTSAHIDAVRDFHHRADMIGFHGQTIFHDPKNKLTWQIGNGPKLADATGMDVVYDFRSNDVKSGGQGAPFLPLYHRVLANSSGLDFPCVILNIGGVANVTWIGEAEDDILAFDTGPGNALIDDWMLKHFQRNYDEKGRIAQSGTVNKAVLESLLANDYFAAAAPKSLDRDEFSIKPVTALVPNDGAATLTAFTLHSIAQSFKLLPGKPKAVYVTGGGRHNDFIMAQLNALLGIPVTSVDGLGWNGDAMEAEGFAYLAVRSRLGLPLSLPTTTGVPKPLTGGKLAVAKPIAA
jgi:anhydro-N-acetylmuramic acid kinase